MKDSQGLILTKMNKILESIGFSFVPIQQLVQNNTAVLDTVIFMVHGDSSTVPASTHPLT